MQKNTEFESFLASKNYPVFTQKDRISIALIERVKPTHFITLSLCQGRQIQGEHGGRTYVRGDDVIYSKTYDGFVRSLSKRLAGRRQWDKHKTILRSACVFEGGNRFVRNHLHMIIAKPDNVDHSEFRIMVIRAAAGNSWIMNGAHSVDIQSVRGSVEAMNVAFYSVKEGLDRVYVS